MHHLSAKALHTLIINKEVKAIDVAHYFLNRIATQDPKISAFLAVHRENTLNKAKEIDAKIAAHQKVGRLAGVPVAFKDNIHIKGELSTCGSQFLSNYRALFDATVTRLLVKEDILPLGKTNMDEFAMGSSTTNSAYFSTKNPWDLTRSPGGSSGGSAAAVAAGLCPLALGSDTGGSIRQPAALCGIVGFKPTYGRVSRYGLVAYASSLDQIGPFGRNVEDVAYIMETLGAPCSHDATSLPVPPYRYTDSLRSPIAGTKIGVPRKLLEHLTKDAYNHFLKALDGFQALGCTLVDVELNLFEYAIAIYYILATAEASTNLARFDGIRYGKRSTKAKTLEEVYSFSREEGFGKEVKQRILLGTYVLSSGYQDAYYRKAQKVRALLIDQCQKAFQTCQIIAMPTSPGPAFKIHECLDPVEMYLQDVYTIPANLAGLPAISIPSGFSQDGLPLGIQLMGPQLHDSAVLNHAFALEQILKVGALPPLFYEGA